MNVQDRRYQRQLLLPQIGEAGQQKLFDASVVIIGAGGLGCGCLPYLAAAGVGKIGIVDGDIVNISNLHRQILFTPNDIGKSKAIIAKEKMLALNPECDITAYYIFIDPHNAGEICRQYDIVIDGSDNFGTRYLLNDVCALLQKPLIYGAVQQFEGQVTIFNAGKEPVNYRDLFPEPPASDAIPNCAEAGVLGILPGIIGNMQANEAIKLITGIGKPLINTMLTYNALTNFVYEVGLEPTAAGRSSLPSSLQAIESILYDITCSNQKVTVEEIETTEFFELLRDKKFKAIDVREFGERPVITSFEHMHWPLSQLRQNAAFDGNKMEPILFCQSGIRSLEAARLFARANPKFDRVYSLKGGVAALSKHSELISL